MNKMTESWETSLYPIIKEYLDLNTDLEENDIVQIGNAICKRFDKFYTIEKRDNLLEEKFPIRCEH